MTALHCRECDSLDCKGFTTRALDEPKPLPAGPGSDDVARAQWVAAGKAAVEEAKRRITTVSKEQR